MFWIFRAKKEFERLKEETKNSFQGVKKDINSITEWISHVNKRLEGQNLTLDEVRVYLSSIESEMEGVKNMLGFLETGLSKRNFKQVFKTQTAVWPKQTAVEGVQTGVQTAFQTPKNVDFQNLSLVERSIIWILLNTDMKLGYDDIAAILGKERATVRGQINNIKKKKIGLIQEIIEKNGKKRLFIPENFKEKMIKNVKVRVSEKSKKNKRK